VVTANTGGNNITLLLGNGSGGLTPSFSTGAGANPIDVVAGDLDRDGVLDLVVAKSTGQDLELLRGTGTSFVTQTGVRRPLDAHPAGARRLPTATDGPTSWS